MTLAEYYVAFATLLGGGLGLIFYVFIHRPACRLEDEARRATPPAG